MSDSEIALLDKCDLPVCKAVRGTDVLISVDGGKSVWCLEHVGDDWLPVLQHGRLSGCAACGNGCVTWFADICLHERCRRLYLMGRPPEVTAEAVKHGAYGRRARSA